ncbi:MAG: hypothetical protein LBU89_06245 [Fibromonadaceae bacterium]|nr:hypothetical protein [Fibromonadaceae bacterium]
MVLRLFVLALFLLLSCTQVERDNAYDPGSENYVRPLSSSSSSLVQSSSSVMRSSSSEEEKEKFIDERDGKKYKYVQIGVQTWMAENLQYEISGTKCYDNNLDNCKIFGMLYDWNTAKTVCPSGWYLPNDTEWNVLRDFVGSNAGTKLKADSDLWISGKGTDDFGFTALPGGHYKGNFAEIGVVAGFWSATAGSQSGSAHFRFFKYNNASLNLDGFWVNNSLAYVRCLKDCGGANQICEDGIIKTKCGTSDDYYDPETQFCNSNIVYKKCDGEVYNPAANKCEDDVLLDKCGDGFFNPETQFCDSDEIYEKCDGEVYNSTANKCEDNILLDKCGDGFFNPETHFCDSNIINEFCNGKTYAATTQKCEDDVLLTKCGDDFFNPATHFCNTLIIYEKCNGETYTPSTRKCEDDILLTGCGSNFFNPATHFCGSNIIYELCNGQAYSNPASRKCEEGVVKDLCWHNSYYDSTKEFCTGGQIYLLCNNKKYDPTKLQCEGNTFQKKCGEVWYDTYSKYCIDNNLIDKEEFIDERDGKKYKYVEIGTQTWMAENLNFDADGSRCYNYESKNCEKYGRLYNWATAMGYPNKYNTELFGIPLITIPDICPEGWRIPNITEWTVLINYVGGNSTAGEKLKTVDHWRENYDGTDEFGFSALPGGSSSNDVDIRAFFWTATEFSATSSRYIPMETGAANTGNSSSKTFTYSVRCIKNTLPSP